MRTIVLAAVGAGIVVAGSCIGAQAMPLAPQVGAAPLVEHVRDRCGPDGFRGRDGFCRPMGRRFFGPGPGYGRPRPVYGQPYYAPRAYGPPPYRY